MEAIMKYRILFTISVVIALLAAFLPTGTTNATGNSQDGQPQCPTYTEALARNPAFIRSLPPECQAKFKRLASTAQQITTQAFALASTGGPDDFGYTYDDTIPFNWTSAPTGNGIIGGDDFSHGPVSIGNGEFTFPFYGQNYSTLFIGSNGILTFDQGSCCDYGGITIPNIGAPNNFIAPFLEDLVIGDPYNTGAIWYATGGSAPERYFIAEWRDVTTIAGSDPFSFEVLLYENGDILVQYQSLPAAYYSTVGIENSTGDDGLGYQVGGTGLSAPIAIKFTYPSTPTARVTVSPITASHFASTDNNTAFPLSITNPGSLGTDTYNLSSASAWPVSFYQDGCVTPLTDTNADAIIDTGPIPQGGFVTICISFTPPSGLGIGDANSASVTVTSSINPAKTKTATMNMTLPAPFAQVLSDYADGAMVLMLNGPGPFRPLASSVTDDGYGGFNLAMIALPSGQYLYAWSVFGAGSFANIEYTIVSHDGLSNDIPVTKLTDNLGADGTNDWSPSLAVLPNGTIGITWWHHISDNINNTVNDNIYFATLSNTGSLLSGPVNLTNNDLWGAWGDITIPHLELPSIAATDDNRFILSWQETRTDGGVFNSNIWYTTLDSSGATVYAPTQFTADDVNSLPVLNPLKDGNAILTWDVSNTANYAILNSSGAIVKPATPLDHSGSYDPLSDAVQLPNGNIAVASATNSGVVLTVLDGQYNTIAGPTYASIPNASTLFGLSATYDSFNHVIVTWIDGDFSPATNMYYAMADDTGTFLTEPMIFWSSADGIDTNNNGQGNAPQIDLPPTPTTLEVKIDIMPGSRFNIINLKNDRFIPVAILSTADFNAPTDVDRQSLTFGKTGEEDSLVLCLKYGVDVNRDRKRDLFCFFSVRKAGFTTGDAEGILQGLTRENVPIVGDDSVKILKPKKRAFDH
jgi:hypothetical protein